MKERIARRLGPIIGPTLLGLPPPVLAPSAFLCTLAAYGACSTRKDRRQCLAEITAKAQELKQDHR
jgi:hypothetical protein